MIKAAQVLSVRQQIQREMERRWIHLKNLYVPLLWLVNLNNTHCVCQQSSFFSPLQHFLGILWSYTGRNHMFPYFWNVAETCNSMFPLCLRLTETWKLKSTCFRHVNGTEMPSHVSVIFKPAHFRRCSFPSCFCKRICSFLLHLT